jgi:hypothetical protein
MKFRQQQLLIDYLRESGVLVGTWLGNINDLISLIDKYSVGDDYIQNLADLVNLTILSDTTTTLDEKRRQLIQVIEWYKRKGTYKAMQFVGYLLGQELNLWDLYTTDYVAFVMQSWYAGDIGTNPPGLGPTYYKSPHIGIETKLNKVYGTGLNSYLFRESMYSDLSSYVELVRPINVVPQYTLVLEAITDQTGNVVIADGNVQTCIIGVWSFSRLYFDGQVYSNVIDDSSDNVIDEVSDQVIASASNSVSFDDGKFFDFTQNTFYNSITRWKLGTGNKGIPPAQFGWNMQTVVLSGSISTTTITADQVVYEFRLPNTVNQAGISELGLYLSNGTTLEVGCTFPDIDLFPGVGLRVKVTINIL